MEENQRAHSKTLMAQEITNAQLYLHKALAFVVLMQVFIDVKRLGAFLMDLVLYKCF